MIDRRFFFLSTTALAAGATPAAAQSGPAVRIGTSPSEVYAEPFFAQDAGIFAKAGLNVEVQLLGTGAAVATALAGGAIDIGVSTITNIANAVAHGVPFVMIAPAAIQTARAPVGLLVVAKSSPIRTAKDLEGKVVAIGALRQITDVALRAWVAKNGADPAKVEVVEAPYPDQGPGIDRGTFAAALISQPSLTNALKHNDVRVLADPYAAIAPHYPIAGWITTLAFAQKNPELVHRLASALLEAGRWANAHPADSASIVGRVTKLDADTVRSGIRAVYGEDVRAADLQPALDAAFKYGFLTRAVSASEIFMH